MDSKINKEIKLSDVLNYFVSNIYKIIILFISFLILLYATILFLENNSRKTMVKININNSNADSLNLINYSLINLRTKIDFQNKLPIERFDTNVFEKNLIGLPESIDLKVINEIILNSNIKNISLRNYSSIEDNSKGSIEFITSTNINENLNIDEYKKLLLDYIKESLSNIYSRHKFLNDQISQFYLENIELSKKFLIRQAGYELKQLLEHLSFQYNLAKKLQIEEPQEKINFDMRVAINKETELLNFGPYYYSLDYTVGYNLLDEIISILNNFDINNSQGLSNLILSEKSILELRDDNIVDRQIEERINLFEPDINIIKDFYLFNKSQYYLHIFIFSLVLTILVTYSVFIYNFFDTKKNN